MSGEQYENTTKTDLVSTLTKHAFLVAGAYVSVCPSRTIAANDSGHHFITSPGYPGSYGNNLSCRLTLEVPSNKSARLAFIFVDIPGTYLSVYIAI